MIGTLKTTEPSDLPALATFLVRVYKFESSDFHFDPRMLEWKYFHPRSGWQGSRSYLMVRDEKIVAHAGVCPISFRLPTGQIVTSLTVMDWAADSSIPGIGVMLFRKIMKMARTSFEICSPVGREVLPHLGFHTVGEAFSYAGWLRPWREFRVRPREPRSVLRLLHGWMHPVSTRRRNGGWEFLPVAEFDDSLQPILCGEKRTWTFCQRTVADLNYLLQCPCLEMRGFVLQREGRLIGYFILGKSGWEARVLDLVVDSEDEIDWEYAYSAATSAALLDPEICRIRVLSTLPILNRALARNGYWCQSKEPMMLYDPSNALGRVFPPSFQFFDGDSGY